MLRNCERWRDKINLDLHIYKCFYRFMLVVDLRQEQLNNIYLFGAFANSTHCSST